MISCNNFIQITTRKFVAKFKDSFRFFEEEEFHEYAKSLAYIGTMRIAGRREGGGKGRRRGCTLITSAKMVGRGDVYEAVASNYALTAAVKASRLPTAILRNSCFRDVIG